ncbi:hypothetical protein [Streptomyces erythrochromogenes]|uniref:hypothetical protein n=1 Tax=Streptomyces erythrochromogenes TaxID=285574 RepID=UPI0038707655|nr:hypothetical protein OG489_12855 [Streptomyces erythrochromogenes]
MTTAAVPPAGPAATGPHADRSRPRPLRRLVRSELRRILSPAPVRWALYALPLLVGAFALAGYLGHDTDMATAWREAEAAYRQYTAEAARRPGTGGPLSAQYFFDDPRYQLTKASFVDLRTVLSGVAVAALAFGLVSGGTDWSSRVILNLVAAEPRRARLFTTRGVLVAAVAGATALATSAVLVPLLLVTAHLRGTTADADAHFWTALVVIVLRGAAFVALVALLGYCLAMLTRSLTVAFGIALAYLVLAERLVRDYVSSLTEFHFSGITFAVLNERLLMLSDKTECVGEIACAAMREGTPATHAFLALGLYLLPVAAAALWRFTRTDIG